MASKDHQQLAYYLKEVHSSLRKSTSTLGAEQAWRNHCKNKHILQKYAEYMEKLATKCWESNFASNESEGTSRITWTADFCYDYFINELYEKHREKEQNIAKILNTKIETNVTFTKPLKLIDVGSCYNPFKIYDYLDVLAVDLCPANDYVLQCDFLNVAVDSYTNTENGEVKLLQESSFDIVTFCFLLEYIPSSDMRISACEKAYNILKPEGLLVISTPDSKHVGANCKLIKCWRYSLALMGFSRVKYEKFKHMHCMAFRKCINKDIAVRWATIHKEPHMAYSINIPQDFNIGKDQDLQINTIEPCLDDFMEMPFHSI